MKAESKSDEFVELSYQDGRSLKCDSVQSAIIALEQIGFTASATGLIPFPDDHLVLFIYHGVIDRAKCGRHAVKLDFKEVENSKYNNFLWKLLSDIFFPFLAGNDIPQHLCWGHLRNMPILVSCEKEEGCFGLDIFGWLKCDAREIKSVVHEVFSSIPPLNTEHILSGRFSCNK